MLKEALYYSGAVVYLLAIPLFVGMPMDAPWLRGMWRIGARVAIGLLWPVFLVGWFLYRGVDNLLKLE